MSSCPPSVPACSVLTILNRTEKILLDFSPYCGSDWGPDPGTTTSSTSTTTSPAATSSMTRTTASKATWTTPHAWSTTLSTSKSAGTWSSYYSITTKPQSLATTTWYPTKMAPPTTTRAPTSTSIHRGSPCPDQPDCLCEPTTVVYTVSGGAVETSLSTITYYPEVTSNPGPPPPSPGIDTSNAPKQPQYTVPTTTATANTAESVTPYAAPGSLGQTTSPTPSSSLAPTTTPGVSGVQVYGGRATKSLDQKLGPVFAGMLGAVLWIWA